MKQIDRIEYLEAQNKKLEDRVTVLELTMAANAEAAAKTAEVIGTLLASLEEEEQQEEAAPLDLDGNPSGGERDQSQPL